MKTLDQVVTGMEFRMSKLQEQMNTLEPQLESRPEVTQIYWSAYERFSELKALLGFIKNETACSTKAKSCGGCATPCSAKKTDSDVQG